MSSETYKCVLNTSIMIDRFGREFRLEICNSADGPIDNWVSFELYQMAENTWLRIMSGHVPTGYSDHNLTAAAIFAELIAKNMVG